MPAGSHCGDVAIIGHGLVGCVVARCLSAAGASVILVDSGSPMSAVPGTHIRNLPACRGDRAFYYDLVRACLRPVSLPPATGLPTLRSVPAMPDGNGVNALQRARVNMPAARVTSLLGGMGTLWNCVTPRLAPRLEQWPGITAEQWAQAYRRAEELLGVGLEASAGSRRQDLMLRALAGRYPAAAAAPVAARRRTDNPQAMRWTGPAEILAAPGPATPPVRVLTQHAVRRLRHSSGRVVAADAIALETGEPVTISADVFVVAAGGTRTPALLWASQIAASDDGRSALGRYLCDHPLAYAQLVLDHELAGGLAWPDPDPFVVIGVSGDRPFHSLLLCDGCDSRVLEGRVDDRLILSLYWYTMTEPRFENRILFSDRSTDVVGLPQPTFEYSLSPQDRELQRAALEDLTAAGRLLGTFLPISPPQILSPGSSLHIMGTTRMGERDDGRSVVDSCGRVWGFANLYLGGTGLIPSRTAANPTLTACAIAVRTADRITGAAGG